MKALTLVLVAFGLAFGMIARDPSVVQPTASFPVDEPNPYRVGKAAVSGWRAIIVLIDFPDYPWNKTDDPNFDNSGLVYTKSHFEDMLFSEGTYRDHRSQSAYTGSMRDYYLENSYGVFDVVGTLTVWYRAPENYSYYVNGQSGFGSYPNNAQKMVEDAIALADPDVDFSLFDNDGDGVVDALFVIHASPGAEALGGSPSYIWSHASSINPQNRDGVTVGPYSTEPEDATIGVVCHEFGHILGIPDLYDYDNSSCGVGEWCLMGSGGWCCRTKNDAAGTSPSHFSAWAKYKLGWLVPKLVTENMSSVLIPPAETAAVAYRLWKGGAFSSQYFLAENRQGIGFDSGLVRRQKDFGLADPSGLVICHVDELTGNNDNENHKKVDVEEATPYLGGSTPYEHLDHTRNRDTYRYLNNGNRGDNGDPWPGYDGFLTDLSDFDGDRTRNRFDEATTPSSRGYGNISTKVSINNIRLVGTDIIANLWVKEPVGSIEEEAVTGDEHALRARPAVFRNETRITAPPGSRLVVFDAQGRRVRELRTGRTGYVSWYGRYEDGRDAPAGVYFCALRGAGRPRSCPVVVIR